MALGKPSDVRIEIEAVAVSAIRWHDVFKA
jgi:hypothetical protein